MSTSASGVEGRSSGSNASPTERLDALANAAPAEPQPDEHDAGHDPDTGEVKEAVSDAASNAEKSNGDKEREVVSSAEGAHDGLSNPTQGSIRSTTSLRQPEAQAAAGGAHPLDVPSELRRESNEPPKTTDEYAAAAKAYIAEADDADWLETRWREERQLRSRLGVPVSIAKVLGDAVLAKAKELRGAR